VKKVAIVGIVGIPACYGGFESLVENITLSKSENICYTVFCSKKTYDHRVKHHNGADLIYLPLKANGVQSVLYDVLSLVKCWFVRPDAVLILGVSGCLFLPFFKVFSKAKIITNIDGLEWKRDKWGALTKKFLKLSEYFAVYFSDVVVTDNQAISDYVSKQYDIKSVTIAYGGDHAIRDINVTHEIESYSLGLCRIEPENNVQMILEAFNNTNEKLKFIGNWSSSEFGISLKEKYGSAENIELLDPIYDLNELYILRSNCSFYVHGHSAGGTNPSLVEMMHFGVPILAFDCDFNRYTTEDKANYFSSSTELEKLLNSSEVYDNSSSVMKEIAERRYTWSVVKESYEQLYK